ncbi:MAG: alpha/beta hydrolase [Methylothermaceae bacteria B42]|nr:MAG: alpha/beta hydrolase [Methylothermaceae bacteria B42]HHJ38335.1 alpha/beta hydrolase [Methylothermaceae bacterium]
MRIVGFLNLFVLLLLTACATRPPSFSTSLKGPALTPETFITSDGWPLPLHQWQPGKQAEAVIVALHGFNDYGRFIEQPAHYFNKAGIAVYSYDQRGFGASPGRGRWAGTKTYANDLATFVDLLRQRHPDTPLYVLGESMGGAVTAVAAVNGLPNVDGLILAAPAVWARWTMPWYQRSLLWLGSHVAPWMKLTRKGLEITPSDNIEMLRALSQDPLVIKATRIDAIAGLTNLMDSALASAPKLNTPTLLLYGEKDEIVPKEPTLAFIRQAKPNILKTAWYDEGYHMLLRDLQGERYWRDILAWIRQPHGPLPSGADNHLPELNSSKIMTMKEITE